MIGPAGRILDWLLSRHAEEGRLDFTNREIRLSGDLRMPDFKNKLETRLLLLAAGSKSVKRPCTSREPAAARSACC